MVVSLILIVFQCVQCFVVGMLGVFGLWFGVIWMGCLGWGYIIDFVCDEWEGDSVFEQEGVWIYVDVQSLLLVDGMVIDYGKQGLSEIFMFRNLNVVVECGCGESFIIDDVYC